MEVEIQEPSIQKFKQYDSERLTSFVHYSDVQKAASYVSSQVHSSLQ